MENITSKTGKLNVSHNGYIIEKSAGSHCTLIYKETRLIKCIAGSINSDGSTDVMEKSKNYIDTNLI